MSGSRAGYGWFFASFCLLLVAAALIGVALVSLLASLTPLHISIALSIAAVVCALVALARQASSAER